MFSHMVLQYFCPRFCNTEFQQIFLNTFSQNFPEYILTVLGTSQKQTGDKIHRPNNNLQYLAFSKSDHSIAIPYHATLFNIKAFSEAEFHKIYSYLLPSSFNANRYSRLRRKQRIMKTANSFHTNLYMLPRHLLRQSMHTNEILRPRRVVPSVIFGRPFVKQFALCYHTVLCLSCPVCLSVCLSVTLDGSR